jgi:hypothetical protein
MKTSSSLFAVALCGITFLGAAMFIANRLLFANQPGIENVFSVIWTVVLGIILYRLLLHAVGPKNTSRRERQRNLYSSLIFICEIMAMVVLLFTAILFTVTLTSGTNQTQLLAVIGFVGLLSLALPIGLRVLRALNHQAIRVEEPSDF